MNNQVDADNAGHAARGIYCKRRKEHVDAIDLLTSVKAAFRSLSFEAACAAGGTAFKTAVIVMALS